MIATIVSMLVMRFDSAVLVLEFMISKMEIEIEF